MIPFVLGALPEGGVELTALLATSAVLSAVVFMLRRESGAAAQTRRRMTTFVKDAAAPVGAEEAQRPFRERVLRPVLHLIAGPLLRFTPQTVLTQAQDSITYAGWKIGPTEFVGIRIGLATLGVVGGLFLAASAGDIEQWQRILAPVVGGFIGYSLPQLFLGQSVKGRQRLIRRALPQTLEVLSVSVEAGLAFDGAIAHIAQRFKGPLSDELRRMFLEFQMGRSRRQAMSDFAHRIGLQQIDRFVQAVVQAEAMGVPLSKVLSDQAGELRTEQRHKAEESARTAPIKMMFPLVLLILPALFMIILGPTVANLLSGGASF